MKLGYLIGVLLTKESYYLGVYNSEEEIEKCEAAFCGWLAAFVVSWSPHAPIALIMPIGLAYLNQVFADEESSRWYTCSSGLLVPFCLWCFMFTN